MNWSLALPEIVLACAAMAILLFGVLTKQKNAVVCTMLAVAALVLAAVLVTAAPIGGAYRGLFVVDGFARFMKLLVLAGAGLSAILALDYNARENIDRYEFPVLILLSTVGMMIMCSTANLMTLYLGLELQSLALYVLCAFARDDVRSSESGLKFFVLGALASGLILYGTSLVYGFAGTMQFGELGPRPLGARRRLCRPGRRRRLHRRRARLQALRRPLPHVDARRLRGRAHACHRLHEHGPQGRRHRADAPRARDALRPAPAPMVRPHRHRLHRLHAARRAGRHRPDQHQAAHGLFQHRPHGLRPRRPRRRLPRGHPRRHDLHGHLCLHERRRLRRPHCHAPPRPRPGTHRGPRRPCPHRPRHGAGHGHLHVQHGRHPAVLRLLRQALRLPARGPAGLLDAGRHRRAYQRRRRLLLPPHHQGDVFRRPEPAFDPRPISLGFVAGIGALVTTLFFVFPAPIVAAAQSAARVLFG